MLFQLMMATGIFRAIMPAKVGNETPNSEVMRSIRIARPVKPLESRLDGWTNAFMA